MLQADQEKLIFLRLEMDSAEKVVRALRAKEPNIAADIQEWEAIYKNLVDRVFEMEILLGVNV